MTVSIRDLALETFVPMLGTVSHLLDKAAEHATARKFELSALANARLAPDMFPLSTQVYLACHHARDATTRLTGQEPPQLERIQETFEQLVARVKATTEYLQSVPSAAFEGGEDRRIEFSLNETLTFRMSGFELLRDWSLPHFYFHVVTAYDILRHSGVELGKRDYMRHVGRYLHSHGGSST